MTCCDADGFLKMVKSGSVDKNSVEGIFRTSALKYWITHDVLDISSHARLPNDENDCNFPVYFADTLNVLEYRSHLFRFI